ncbi:MAG TPA: hypothetical protein VI547_01100 [Anaerolineales bacterium]|nr:hypothetical protein [Anaerolineales bacterium]
MTFLEPIRDQATPRNLDRFWASFGAWKSAETAGETVKRITKL